MKIIDLTQPLRPVAHDRDPRISYIDHRRGAQLLGLAVLLYPRTILAKLASLLNFLLGRERIVPASFPDSLGLAIERFSGDTHTGTHLDAPYHFGPLVAGKPALTIDKVPLQWCIGDGVLIDVSNRPGPAPIDLPEVAAELARLDYRIKPFDIVLFKTGAARFYGQCEYRTAHPGVAPAAVAWLIQQGVRIMGIDAFSFDKPFDRMAQEYYRTRDPETLWPTHLLGRTMEYCHIENVGDLDVLPSPTGFRVICMPIPIANASAGWVRLVAIVDD